MTKSSRMICIGFFLWASVPVLLRAQPDPHSEHDHGAVSETTDPPRETPGSPQGETAHEEDGAHHDHATDHGGAGPWASLGKLHVLMVHFPVALLLVAVVLEGIGAAKGSERLLSAGRVNFVLGGLGALLAAPLGWIQAAQSTYGENLDGILFRHRWLGVSVAVIALLGCLGLFLSRRGGGSGLFVYRVVCVLLVILVPLAAHFGGSLVFGPGYFPW